jgi:hypothetical protein
MDDFPESPTTSAPASPRVSHEENTGDAATGQKARWEQPSLRRLAWVGRLIEQSSAPSVGSAGPERSD